MSDTLTINIDDRIGSDYTYLGRGEEREKVSLSDFFRQHRSCPEVRVIRLIAGDFCFSGNGAKGPSLFGIERKTIKDMLSSKRTGRFSGEQLPKMIDQYDYRFLVVEGEYRTNWQTGLIEIRGYDPETRKYGWKTLLIGKQHFLGLELDSYLNELDAHVPIKIRHTQDFPATVEYVLGLAHTYNKPWDRHTAYAAIHTPEPYVMIEKASTVRRVAYSLAGVGWVRSGAAEARFHTVAEMVAADAGDWAKLDGFGKVLSQKVFNELHGLETSGNNA